MITVGVVVLVAVVAGVVLVTVTVGDGLITDGVDVALVDVTTMVADLLVTATGAALLTAVVGVALTAADAGDAGFTILGVCTPLLPGDSFDSLASFPAAGVFFAALAPALAANSKQNNSIFVSDYKTQFFRPNFRRNF